MKAVAQNITCEGVGALKHHLPWKQRHEGVHTCGPRSIQPCPHIVAARMTVSSWSVADETRTCPSPSFASLSSEAEGGDKRVTEAYSEFTMSIFMSVSTMYKAVIKPARGASQAGQTATSSQLLAEVRL